MGSDRHLSPPHDSYSNQFEKALAGIGVDPKAIGGREPGGRRQYRELANAPRVSRILAVALCASFAAHAGFAREELLVRSFGNPAIWTAGIGSLMLLVTIVREAFACRGRTLALSAMAFIGVLGAAGYLFMLAFHTPAWSPALWMMFAAALIGAAMITAVPTLRWRRFWPCFVPFLLIAIFTAMLLAREPATRRVLAWDFDSYYIYAGWDGDEGDWYIILQEQELGFAMATTRFQVVHTDDSRKRPHQFSTPGDWSLLRADLTHRHGDPLAGGLWMHDFTDDSSHRRFLLQSRGIRDEWRINLDPESPIIPLQVSLVFGSADWLWAPLTKAASQESLDVIASGLGTYQQLRTIKDETEHVLFHIPSETALRLPEEYRGQQSLAAVAVLPNGHIRMVLGEMERRTGGGRAVTWSAAGRTFLPADATFTILELDPTTGVPRLTTDWQLPDGTTSVEFIHSFQERIVFQLEAGDHVVIVSVDPATGESRHITLDPAASARISIFPNTTSQQLMVWERGVPGGTRLTLHTPDLEPVGTVLLDMERPPWNYRFSPDGRRMAFLGPGPYESNRLTHFGIADFDSGNTRIVETFPGYGSLLHRMLSFLKRGRGPSVAPFAVAWRPDSRAVAYSVFVPNRKNASGWQLQLQVHEIPE